MSSETQRPGRKGLPTRRLDAFSDGVFAIAITLLVLEIAVPVAAERDLLGALVAEWPAYLAYVVSYLTIGWVWVGHAAITSHIQRARALFLRLNLLLLMAVAFLPFPTAVMAGYLGKPEPERVAVVFYGLVLLAIAVLMDLLGRYAISSEEVQRADLADEELATLESKATPSVVALLGSIVVGILVPTIGVLCFLVVSAWLVIPFRTLWGGLTHRGD